MKLVVKRFRRFWSICLCVCSAFLAHAKDSSPARPFIWVQDSDRGEILKKIETQAWARSLYEGLKERADDAVRRHAEDREGYLRELPIDWSKDGPVFYRILEDEGGAEGLQRRRQLMLKLQAGIDCGVLYYLTGDERYARPAADTLSLCVEALLRLEPASDSVNGGWIYPNNHLMEVRVFGAQFPIIYDFIHSYVSGGGLVYDPVSGEEKVFPFGSAQSVFRTYVNLALNVGMSGTNWPVLESSCLLHNTLALDDEAERAKYLPFYLDQDLEHQDPLSVVAERFEKPGDMWPESLQYSKHVASLSVYFMTLLDRLYPDLDLGAKYPNIVDALAAVYFLQYPNEDVVSFGDGQRRYSVDYEAFELGYLLASLNGNHKQVDTFGALIKTGIASGDYDRGHLPGYGLGANPYFTPLALLWHVDEIKGESRDYPLPRTDALPFASLYLQRNLSEENSERDSLMAFVAGGHYVHGHASGMNIEVYGKGEVLGVDAGKSQYRTDIHENYYRLFAAHNTVVSNGASASKGGWVNLGINPLELVAMEPMAREAAVSPDFSFSTTRFFDEFNLVAPARHERTLAVVRTSDSTGYYVDVFRAKSDFDQQFHDYLYHNVGDELVLTERSGKQLKMSDDKNRFSASSKLPWESNKQYRHPGWHFFKEVKSSGNYVDPLEAIFEGSHFDDGMLGMRVFMNGYGGRSYATVLAPPTKNTVSAYAKKGTPTLVVRQEGEAWNRPFAAVYESYRGKENTAVVQSVDTLLSNGMFSGFKVSSVIQGERVVDYVLVQDSEKEFENAEYGIAFFGHFAIVRTRSSGELISLYIGAGESLRYGSSTLRAEGGRSNAFRKF